jgi:hypothetical protein
LKKYLASIISYRADLWFISCIPFNFCIFASVFFHIVTFNNAITAG